MKAKSCRKCRKMKPLSEYYRNGKRLRTECKTCNGAMNAPRYQTEHYKGQKWIWYYENRDEHIDRSRKNRIERKYPYLRSEEYKQQSGERTTPSYSFFDLKTISKECRQQIRQMVKEMAQ